ncbi:uncharacterized protein MONOS_4908 [Monocercomonoides exilis]|uniref:uncharacterized protein n=1 Tax=Monocercomonoides exilis TaxID=2049356 RepID=UPI00355AB54D|nr:hypothetical protein MONOS_4908 [Monocercomonoides exilis]|eukprot:MONOS_4908.1-p1 / transcript=MONOS_4908.1 / gene=MONOS_4908 / organism=Monocercomonoides_exilis_PA203 / gene_product=unspecified product / transcript_product=unspecified product / location=Mono_scaffold00137:54848-58351(+) / protein_length=1024 / sequence_SO=supercontig / SO=protein_coding / is_pseudo=false
MLFVILTFAFATSQELNEEKPYTVYVKQSGSDTNTGTSIGQEMKSLKSAYDLLGNNQACKIYVVNETTAFKAEKIIFGKSSGITIEGVNSDGNGNTMVSMDCDVEGTLYVNCYNSEITFTVGDGGVTSFTSCSCSDGKSGGICLYGPNITSESQLKWPSDGTNLVFQDCKCGEGQSKRNIVLYFVLNNDYLFKDIADTMKASFAANYTNRDNNEFIICGIDNAEIDIVSEYYSIVTTCYVKSGAENGDGLNFDSPTGSVKKGYCLFADDVSFIGYYINIIDAKDKLKAEQIAFDKNEGVTVEGINSQGTGNTMVSIDCNVHSDQYLFSCLRKVEFVFLAFYFPIALSDGYHYDSALIYGCDSLTIKNCQFIRPSTNRENVDYHLVLSEDGDFYMDNVECVDDSRNVSFDDKVFNIRYSNTVSFTNVTLKKISSGKPIVQIYGDNVVDVTLNNCTFTECQTESEGSLYISSYNSESTFTVGDGGVTSFTSCSCTNDKSGGIYLDMPNIQFASQLKWPKDGKNLVFQNCSAAYNGEKRNTGLLLAMNYNFLFKDIADSMKLSFAADYTRRDNRWNIVGCDLKVYQLYDFTSTYFDPPPPKPDNMTRVFVKKGGKGNGVDVNSAINSIFDAYEYLEKSGKCFIDIIKTAESVKAERIIFSTNYGITIEGVNENGKGNIEVAIDCDVSVSSILFSCQRVVEFKYLAFQFSSTEKNWDLLICAGYDSTSLKISTCRFVRIGSQSQEGMNSNADGDNPLASSLVSVTSGSVEMDTVKCSDETSFVSFSSSPFSFSGAREVSLRGMDISKVNVESGAAISISDGSNSSSKVSIEGLNVQEVKSEKGAAAGLDITLSSEESRVAIGRSSKCSFKSCSAPEGKSGAIFIEMPKATSNLKLPSEHNLEIDSSNTAGSKTTSLFIIAPDFDKFCKQEDVFAFANDFDESTAGWIEGAIDEESEPEDVYEKYVKVRQEKLKEQNKKRMAGIVVAIVVPIVVVVAAVVVIVIVVVVVRKRRTRIEENDDKEQEMKD